MRKLSYNDRIVKWKQKAYPESEFQITFVEFVNEVRLGEVTQLLFKANKSIYKICYEYGF
ncbi:MAG TPA: hypothetical protein VKX35_04150 [Fermentimonas sp.]|nr:hypothetical protein [Fermentimonas sp.]